MQLGWQLPAGVTLHAIERRFAEAGRNPIASYARALGRHRYEPGPAHRAGGHRAPRAAPARSAGGGCGAPMAGAARDPTGRAGREGEP